MASRQSIDRIFSEAVACKAMPGIVAAAATAKEILY